jgi:hypothetical protein
MLTMVRLLRHRQTKGAVTDMPDLRDAKPVLYSTRWCESITLRTSHPFEKIEKIKIGQVDFRLFDLYLSYWARC